MKNALSGMGLAADTAMVTFPIDVFLPDADLTPLTARRQEIYDGLTHWTPTSHKAGDYTPLAVEAATYEAALTRANDLFIASRWGDGLPLWPATPERVNWILCGSAFPSTHVLGKFPPRGGVATVEACAIALAMAGGRPEYLPVLLATVEAFLDSASVSDELQATSSSPFPVVIVNGPIGGQIRVNSGFGCLGPDPEHPAGASIGRALRQLQQNLGGAVPGSGTMAVWGAMRYTNAVFAEDEAGLPREWPTHGAERHGYAAGTNSISLLFANGVCNIMRHGAGAITKEQDAVQGLHRIAEFMATPHLHFKSGYEDGTPGIVLLSGAVAGALAELGWNKKKIQQFLWEQSKIPMERLRRTGALAWLEIAPSRMVRESINLDPWPITAKPENITLVVAGGDHSAHAYWLQTNNHVVIGRAVTVPEGFDRLLEDARRDLSAHRAPA